MTCTVHRRVSGGVAKTRAVGVDAAPLNVVHLCSLYLPRTVTKTV